MGKIKEALLDLEVGRIEFDGHIVPVYRDLNDPLFLVQDVVDLLGYPGGEHYLDMLIERCENGETIGYIDNTGIYGPFVTELGLYNIFSQERGPLGRKWRRVINDEIVKTRRQRGLNIIAQFDEWDDILDTLYIDEETGILMQSVTVAGGDVDQVTYKFVEE